MDVNRNVKMSDNEYHKTKTDAINHVNKLLDKYPYTEICVAPYGDGTYYTYIRWV